jgi:arylsulfatase
VDYYVKKFGDEIPYRGDSGYFPHRYPRAAYAAMVSYLDERVGELVAFLKEKGLYENTLIMFSSDNGPTFNGGTDSPWFASGGPFPSERGRGKGSLYEGGIRVPLIASWPGKISPGTESDHVSAFWDLLPTLCEVADAESPGDVDGISFLPELLGAEGQQEHPHLYWEFHAYGGQQAVRKGPWKAIRSDLQNGNLDMQLYHLETDQREENNLASEYPELIAEMEEIMKKEHKPATLERFRMEALGDPGPE